MSAAGRSLAENLTVECRCTSKCVWAGYFLSLCRVLKKKKRKTKKEKKRLSFGFFSKKSLFLILFYLNISHVWISFIFALIHVSTRPPAHFECRLLSVVSPHSPSLPLHVSKYVCMYVCKRVACVRVFVRVWWGAMNDVCYARKRGRLWKQRIRSRYSSSVGTSSRSCLTSWTCGLASHWLDIHTHGLVFRHSKSRQLDRPDTCAFLISFII